jgi:hypothetical protein
VPNKATKTIIELKDKVHKCGIYGDKRVAGLLSYPVKFY